VKTKSGKLTVRPIQPVLDIKHLVAIDASCYKAPWTAADFSAFLDQHTCNGYVVEKGNKVLGYLLYEAAKHSVYLHSMSVFPAARRQGAGRSLINCAVENLLKKARKVLHTDVRETNLSCQLFMRAMKFRAVSVIPEYYEDTHEDSFRMEFRLDTK